MPISSPGNSWGPASTYSLTGGGPERDQVERDDAGPGKAAAGPGAGGNSAGRSRVFVSLERPKDPRDFTEFIALHMRIGHAQRGHIS